VDLGVVRDRMRSRPVPLVRAVGHLAHFGGGLSTDWPGARRSAGRLCGVVLWCSTWILRRDGASDGDLARMKEIVISLGAVPGT